MAAQVWVTVLLYLAKFDSSDGSTCLGHTCYNNLLNFDHPGGSTSWGYICYYILVKFHSPDGSTNWGPKYYNIHKSYIYIYIYNDIFLNLIKVFPK